MGRMATECFGADRCTVVHTLHEPVSNHPRRAGAKRHFWWTVQGLCYTGATLDLKEFFYNQPSESNHGGMARHEMVMILK
jgi:hypothetical protein